MEIKIRRTRNSDTAALSEIIAAAFGELDSNEKENVNLVKKLLTDPTAQPIISLLASAGDQPAGHILFTRVEIDNSRQPVKASILAPLAVHPANQNRGIGGLLISEGLTILKKQGFELVFVLGHPDYYSRFGFIPAGLEKFQAPYPIPPKHAGAWMVQELQPGILTNSSGKVVCAAALDDPRYW